MPSVEDVAKRQSLLGAGGVFVRAAQIADAAALIKLNEEFRKNMLHFLTSALPSQTLASHPCLRLRPC